MTSWRDVIKIHPAADLFPLMSREELQALGKDIKANGLTSPIVFWREGDRPQLFLDGRNRLDAMESVGMVVVKDGKLGGDLHSWHVIQVTQDPYEYVISANIHRRHLTAAKKGDVIAALLKAKPERSDGVDPVRWTVCRLGRFRLVEHLRLIGDRR